MEQNNNRVNIVFLRDTPCKICNCETLMKVQSMHDNKRKVTCLDCYTYFACPNCCRESQKLEEDNQAAWIQAQHTRHIKPCRELFMGINSNYRTLLLEKGEKMPQ